MDCRRLRRGMFKGGANSERSLQTCHAGRAAHPVTWNETLSDLALTPDFTENVESPPSGFSCNLRAPPMGMLLTPSLGVPVGIPELWKSSHQIFSFEFWRKGSAMLPGQCSELR
jgi:hypothetical protein